ncbi:MAG: DEAD/DEAH box helicase [Moraxella sp.]|nr:DEAD/DEAH box helicase [Moraxella sp.]
MTDTQPTPKPSQALDSADLAFTFFHELPLTKPILKAVQELGFEKLTPIQSQILPFTLANQDAIGQAQTGTGKTATFLITIIEALLKNPFKSEEARFLGEPRALILAPTRELAQQILEDCRLLTKHTPLYSLCITGGADFDKQAKQLERRPLDILIGTPGRIIDWVQKGVLFLDRVEVFVLDEADRMLDMGFIPDIKRIVRHLPANTHRQSLLFSATFNTDVMSLAYRWLFNPVFVEIAKAQKTNADIEQRFYLLSEDKKMQALKQLLRDNSVDKCIIFANRKDQVKRLHDHLAKRYEVVMLSGDVVQQKREKHLQKFKTGEVKLLVATDVAGRGIHVDDVTHVINFTLPDMPDDYVHRIGRTGRAGQTGISVSFVSEDDAFNLPALEKHLNTRFELHQFEFEDTKKLSSKSSADNQPSQHNSSDESIE